jgi:hypothetical protein
MDYNALATDSVQKSLLFRARAKVVRDYPAVLDVLLRIHNALLVDDPECDAIPATFTISLPPGYDVGKNSAALAMFGWIVRPDGRVINM